jgi:Uma2 family endonuclease
MIEASLFAYPEIAECIVPLSVEAYHKLCETDEIYTKTELFEGMVLQKMTKSAEHSFFSELLAGLIFSYIPAGYFIRIEKPLTIGSSEPEPDICVVAGDIYTYQTKNPTTALLVVEIAHSSAFLDRLKAKIYAKANIPDYWIVSTKKKQIEAFSGVSDGRYINETVYSTEEKIPIFGSHLDMKQIFN